MMTEPRQANHLAATTSSSSSASSVNSSSNSHSNHSVDMASQQPMRLPFPFALYDMLDDAETKNFTHIVRWNSTGTAFKVFDTNAFTKQIVGRYFRQTKYKSFLRQLHLYGFDRVAKGVNKGYRMHDLFRRGDRNMSSQMKPLKSRTQRASSAVGGSKRRGGGQAATAAPRAPAYAASRALEQAQSVVVGIGEPVRPVHHNTSIGVFSFDMEMPSSEVLMKNAIMRYPSFTQMFQPPPIVTTSGGAAAPSMVNDDLFDDDALQFLDEHQQQMQLQNAPFDRHMRTGNYNTNAAINTHVNMNTNITLDNSMPRPVSDASFASILGKPVLSSLLQTLEPTPIEPSFASVATSPPSVNRMLAAIQRARATATA